MIEFECKTCNTGVGVLAPQAPPLCSKCHKLMGVKKYNTKEWIDYRKYKQQREYNKIHKMEMEINNMQCKHPFEGVEVGRFQDRSV